MVFLLTAMVLASFLVIILFKILTIRKKFAIVDSFPGPPSNFLFGSALAYPKHPRDFGRAFKEWSVLYGAKGCYRTWVGPFVPVLVVFDPHHVRLFLGNLMNIDKGDQYAPLKDWLQNGLITVDSNQWRHTRKLLSHVFHFNRLEEYIRIFEKNVDASVIHLSANVEFDIYEWLKRITFENICDSAFGLEENAVDWNQTEFATSFFEIGTLTMKRIVSPLMRTKLYLKLTSQGRRYSNLLKSSRRNVQNIVCMKPRKENDCTFIGTLRKSKKANGESLTDKEIAEQSETILFAG